MLDENILNESHFGRRKMFQIFKGERDRKEFYCTVERSDKNVNHGTATKTLLLWHLPFALTAN